MPKYFHHIEIELTSVCDMRCKYCDRFITHAPDKNMSIKQIEMFITESMELNYPWERIHVLGGEPTLHPNFKEIMALLITYKNVTGLKLLRVITNNHGKLLDYNGWLKDNGVDVYSDYKQEDVVPYFFDNMLQCPADKSPEPLPHCSICGVSGCGVGMTRYGYFLCGAGGAIARLCGYDIGAKTLKDVTWENMIGQAGRLCNKCGHKDKILVSEDDSTGRFWRNQIKQYKNGNIPQMTVLYEE